jgi:cytochrome c biogenesis protein CcmG, thiol:disulfide interchange protein DsbE
MGDFKMNKTLSGLFFAALLLAATVSISGCGKAGPVTQANAPDVTFKDLQGSNLTLASLKGKVVVVNFWATWCAPCRVEIPMLMGVQQKYSSQGLTLLGVAMDDEGTKVVQPFVQTMKFNVGGQPMTMNYPIVIGNDDISTKFGGMLGLPMTYLISRDGKVAKKYMGALTEAELTKDIQSLL